MPKLTIDILSTKLLGKQLTSVAAAKNILIDEIPFIKTKTIAENLLIKYVQELPDAGAALIFTSLNALNAIKDFIIKKNDYKIFCVGNKTKNLAEKIFGEQSISGFANNAAELSKKIINTPSIKSVWFFCGDQRRDELPENLKKHNIEVHEMIVYSTIENAVKIAKNYDGILFFSPSAVTSFFSKNVIDEATKIFAIGNTTANEIKLHSGQPVIITETPDTNEMITLVMNHFSNSKIL